jgi:hypothetical protein
VEDAAFGGNPRRGALHASRLAKVRNPANSADSSSRRGGRLRGHSCAFCHGQGNGGSAAITGHSKPIFTFPNGRLGAVTRQDAPTVGVKGQGMPQKSVFGAAQRLEAGPPSLCRQAPWRNSQPRSRRQCRARPATYLVDRVSITDGMADAGDIHDPDVAQEPRHCCEHREELTVAHGQPCSGRTNHMPGQTKNGARPNPPNVSGPTASVPKDPQPSVDRIDELARRILTGDILLPKFQREFVWDRNQIIDLLDSIARNFPIGSILLWQSRQELRSENRIAELDIDLPRPDYPVNYLLDGQQRLSSICGALYWRANDPRSRWNIAYDLRRRSFMHLDDLDDPPLHQIRLNKIPDPSAFFGHIASLDTLQAGDKENLKQAAHDLFNRFKDYKIAVVTLGDMRSASQL